MSHQPYSRAELQVHNNLPHLRASIGETAGLATVRASINETAGLATRKCESCLLATGVVSFFCSAALFSSSSSFSRGTATRKDSPTHLCVCILVKYAMHSGLAKISTSINGKSNHGCYEGSTNINGKSHNTRKLARVSMATQVNQHTHTEKCAHCGAQCAHFSVCVC